MKMQINQLHGSLQNRSTEVQRKKTVMVAIKLMPVK